MRCRSIECVAILVTGYLLEATRDLSALTGRARNIVC